MHQGAKIGKGVSIQSFCVVEDGANIGDGTVLYPGVCVGKGALVGAGCVLYQGVVIREGCVVGDRVIIHCNTVVGSDGFGYARDGAKYVKVPQKGIVRIGDDVELGACVTVDRATIGETVIGRGTKIDNLVQIAHNVKIGEDTVIVAQAGIAGSTKIGSRSQLGGQVGVAGHLTIGDEVGVGVLVSLTRGRINLNFGVLGIFIGLGLLRFRRGWRTCALLFTWIALVFVPVFALLVFGGAHPIHVKLFGQRVGSTSPGTALFIAGAVFAVALWQYRVLTRRDVVQLFNEQAEPGAAPKGGPATWPGHSGGTEGPPSLS